MTATVVRSTGKWYRLLSEDGRTIDARLRGRIRLQGRQTTNPVAVGDVVDIEPNDDDTWRITDIHERHNAIVRQSPRRRNQQHVLAANLDQALLMATMARPRTSTGFLDRFLLTAEADHIPTILVFNKQDDLSDTERVEQDRIAAIYRSAGYDVLLTSAVDGTGVEVVRERLRDKVTLLCGHSGVGKSTLANAIDPELDLRTGAISAKHEKGMHTTTFAERLPLSVGGWVVDIPGIKEFGVIDFEEAEVSHYYPEMRALLPDCRFNDCLHESEPGCAVRAALDDGTISEVRYANYLGILGDVRAARRW